MSIPERIPIARIEDYYTRNIGTYDNGKQFMAFVVAAIDKGKPETDWRERKRWYAVLHRFDADGGYLETDHWYAGTTADGETEVLERASERRDEFMSMLQNISFENISIKLFKTTIDGHAFGLFKTDEGTVELQPYDFVFYPPWNGEYDT